MMQAYLKGYEGSYPVGSIVRVEGQYNLSYYVHRVSFHKDEPSYFLLGAILKKDGTWVERPGHGWAWVDQSKILPVLNGERRLPYYEDVVKSEVNEDDED